MRVEIPGVGRPEGTVRLTFGGREIAAAPGQSLAAALLDAGFLELGEAGDGRGRGVFCGMGACGECAVTADGAPGRLACLVEVREGMRAEPAPARPPPPGPPAAPLESREIAPAALVVGGGPAGLTAAAVIAEAGAEAVLVDERSHPGGQFYKQPSPACRIDEARLDSQFRRGRELLERAERAGVRVISGVNVWGAFRPDLLLAQGRGAAWTLRPQRLVLAAGAREKAVPIPGWTLPGVMTTGAAQSLLRSSQTAPGRRVIFSGNGPLNMQAAAELARAGTEIVAVAEQADLRWTRNLSAGAGMAAASPGLVGHGFAMRAALARRRVPVLDRSSVTEIRGEGRVRAAVIARLDGGGRPIAGTEREYEADAVCLGYGFVPSSETARALGCRHRTDPETGDLVAVRTAAGRTSKAGVWVVGDAGEIEGAYAAEAMGEAAGWDVLADLGAAPPGAAAARRRAEGRLRRQRAFQRGLRRLYRAVPLTTQLADDRTIVCRCESVELGALRDSFAGPEGAGTAGAAKRLTRAGMGQCQGRWCGPVAEALAARAGGTPRGEFSGFAPAAPVRPVSIAGVASAAPPPSR